MTSVDFKVLDELTEDLLEEAIKRSLNVLPQSLCPNEEQSSFISCDSDGIASLEMNVPRIFIPSFLDKLKEFNEVSSEIRNTECTFRHYCVKPKIKSKKKVNKVRMPNQFSCKPLVTQQKIAKQCLS
ncbi:hypothetical protein QTP88_023734 [Uroleucon formosanum]